MTLMMTYMLQSGDLLIVRVLLCIVGDELHSRGVTAMKNIHEDNKPNVLRLQHTNQSNA